MLWIVQRDPTRRQALARLAGATEDTVLGGPGDRVFDSAPAPEVVLLGLAEDMEVELEFAHRFASRVPEARWVLLVDPADVADARRLFDTLEAEELPFPPSGAALRHAISAARTRRGAEPLSARDAREDLTARFRRYFADLDMPEILRALDPRLADVPLLVRGEPGVGRGLLAHYLHRFGPFGTSAAGAFLAVPCLEVDQGADLLERIRSGAPLHSSGGLTLCLEELDALPRFVQREVRNWIERGLPGGVTASRRVRWMATAGDLEEPQLSALESGLSQTISGIGIRIPPLRVRREAIVPFAIETARAWSSRHGGERRLADDALEALRLHPWPGNLRELEAVVLRTLAAEAVDPIQAYHLRFEEVESPPVFLPEEEEPEFVVIAEEEDGDIGTAEEAEPLPEMPEEMEPLQEELPREVSLDEFPEPTAPSPVSLKQVSAALAHEVRNPLVAIRTFAELLPHQFDDPEFRERFQGAVVRDVQRLESLAMRLSELADLDSGAREPIDVAQLVGQLLEDHRVEIHQRRLVVLEELDRERPLALASAAALRFAFETLVSRAFALVPDRGDLYVASRHLPSQLAGAPALRLLLRFQTPGRIAPTSDIPGVSLAESSIDFVLPEIVLREQGASLTIDDTESSETLILVDLPAPA